MTHIAIENHHFRWENPRFRLGHVPVRYVCWPEDIYSEEFSVMEWTTISSQSLWKQKTDLWISRMEWTTISTITIDNNIWKRWNHSTPYSLERNGTPDWWSMVGWWIGWREQWHTLAPWEWTASKIVVVLPWMYHYITGWWFGTWLLFFHINWESSSQLTNSYFSEGFKPPTRLKFESWENLWKHCSYFPELWMKPQFKIWLDPKCL